MNSQPTTALIVDDEPSICWGFEQLLAEEGMTVITASSAEAGLELATTHQPALIVLDVRLPGIDGLTALPKFTAASPASAIIIMTAFGDLQTAVQAVRRGAADYLTKPFGIDRARTVCRTVLQQREIAQRQGERTPEGAKVPGDVRLIGRSPVMQELYRRIAMVADSNLPVLIRGEAGTGKKLVAAAIHGHSPRRHGPYLATAPASLHPTLMESELFGHQRGAFAGADEDRQGMFHLAQGGSLFLDQVGDLPPTVQAKLLHAIEQQRFTPVGASQSQTCDVRVLTSSDIDLQPAIAAGEFREDLYQRLAAVEVLVPPLRERLDDLELLVQHFLKRAGHAAADLPLDPVVLDALRREPWPGNVRQLRTVIEHAAVASRGRPLTLAHLPALPGLPPNNTAGGASGAPGSPNAPADSEAAVLAQAVRTWTQQACQSDQAMDLMNRFLAAVEPTLLEAVLEHTQGNRLAAAELLGIHRGTLRDRLRRYGIQP